MRVAILMTAMALKETECGDVTGAARPMLRGSVANSNVREAGEDLWAHVGHTGATVGHVGGVAHVGHTGVTVGHVLAEIPVDQQSETSDQSRPANVDEVDNENMWAHVGHTGATVGHVGGVAHVGHTGVTVAHVLAEIPVNQQSETSDQ